MNNRASLNHSYRLVWSERLQSWVAVAEHCASRGKSGGVHGGVHGGVASSLSLFSALSALSQLGHLAHLGRATVLATGLLLGAGHAAWAQSLPTVAATALPTGAQYNASQVSISTSGAQMTVQQSVQRAVINWNSYNIGSQAGVDYRLPNQNAVSLNRVLGNDPSQILGRLTSNGQVWIVNPNGVLFGAGSRVDVAGLVASTLAIRDEDFLAGRNLFSRNGSTARVLNQGEINATGGEGGLVALLAPEVRNEGIIRAQMGNVALAGGENVTLNLGADGRLKLVVDPASIDTLVENKHLIQADGGQVILSARAANQLSGAVINNGGVIEARSLSSRGGVIRLEGSSSARVAGGKLDVSGKEAGDQYRRAGRGGGGHLCDQHQQRHGRQFLGEQLQRDLPQRQPQRGSADEPDAHTEPQLLADRHLHPHRAAYLRHHRGLRRNTEQRHTGRTSQRLVLLRRRWGAADG